MNQQIQSSLRQEVEELKILSTYAFCIMDLNTTRVIFENFYRYPELLAELPETSESLNINIYSGLLQSLANEDLERLCNWLRDLRNLDSATEVKGTQEQAPQFTLKGKSQEFQVSFIIHNHHESLPYVVLIQLSRKVQEVLTLQVDLILQLLDECFQGLRFNEAYYNYSIMEVAILMDTMRQYTTSVESLDDNLKLVLSSIREIKEIAIWLQLHRISEVATVIEENLHSPHEELPTRLEELQQLLNMLSDFVEMALAVAQYARHRKDIGHIRRRTHPYGMEERRFRKLLHDFDILRRLIDSEDNYLDMAREQWEKCYNLIVSIDSQLLNHVIPRLKSIAIDLSNEMDKEVQFVFHNCPLITANHFSQHHISKSLINTLKYLIIEHLEIPKERRLASKPTVCRLSLNVLDSVENIEIQFIDDGIHFDETLIIERAVQRKIITQDIGEWMLENDPQNIHNLMTRPNFGPPVKPPPLTRYRPYLCMIAEEITHVQGKMTFTTDEAGNNKVSLVFPKSVNNIVVSPYKYHST